MAEHNTNPGGPGTDNPDPNPDPRPDEIPSPPPPPDIPIPDPPPPPFGDPADPPKRPLKAEASNILGRSAVEFVYCAAEAFETAIADHVLNRMNEFGRPQSIRVS